MCVCVCVCGCGYHASWSADTMCLGGLVTSHAEIDRKYQQFPIVVMYTLVFQGCTDGHLVACKESDGPP